MNESLLAPYSMEEVRNALFQMHPSKAPGPDGMSPFFFHKYWDLVGSEVKEVQNMSQLRPISLCNVLYKIASKVLANRLKVLLPAIISPQQSAFVPDRGQEGFLALKLDITKVYDRLEWDFLRKIMLKMGFAAQWVDLIMFCLSTVRYSFLINGIPRGFVTPYRGLRQGDPISPYLFLLCAEGLSTLISHSVANGQWQGLRVCDGAHVISHLLFADDSMLYSNASSQDCILIRNILNVYERASGQKINLQKSSVVFSVSVPSHMRQSLADILDIQVVDKHEKYLGIPTLVGRSKADTFAYIKDTLSKKLTAQQGWRLIQDPESLVGRLLKAIYFPHCNFWDAEVGSAPSYAWRSILNGRDIMQAGIRRHIGDGKSTNVWTDPWLIGEDLTSFYTPRINMVSDLILSPGVWNQVLLQELFPLHITQKILALPLSNHMHDDRWIWSGDKKGGFTIKSAYHIARDRVLGENSGMPNSSAELWNWIWQAPVPRKVKICVWKAASNILPSRSRLSERGIDIDTQCPFCDEEIESPLHASPTTFATLLMVIWATSHNRNAKVWGDAAKLASEVVPLTLGWWEEFKVAHSSSRLASPIQNVRWNKPPIGMIKLNVDAAFSNVCGSVGVGGVFRDFEGSCLGGFRHTLPAASSARHAELVALLVGAQLAISHQLVETNCQDLVQVVAHDSLDHSELGYLLSDLQEALQLASFAQVHHVRRAANIVAHTLAQDAKNRQFFMQLFTVPPPNVVELISIDCNDL
ncbi:uncharacterized protein LOC133744326 [Rosa rugosa]|uniref:uncharacterized protein LOC133744326 n=1 Tax=Rosa rugosa TaxID=74645 RepID=UPI002B4150A0|nr:uncharacterized protein LOC133744326 [Rosa rugosa]